MLTRKDRDRIGLRVGPYGKPAGLCDTRRLLNDIHELRHLLWKAIYKTEYQRDSLADWRAQTRERLSD